MSGGSPRGNRIRWVDILDRPDIGDSQINSLPPGLVVKLLSGLRAAIIQGGGGVTVTGGDGASGVIQIRLNQLLVALLEALVGEGFLVRTGSTSWALRNLVAPAAGFTIANPAGRTGNPTFALSDDLAALEALASTGIAVRTALNTWAQRSLVPPAAGITISNAAGVAGNPTLVLANDLAALEGLGSTGFAVRTAADTWAQRSIALQAALDAVLSISNPAGIADNPTLSLDVQDANTVFAGPASGANSAPTFRALVAGDLPFAVASYSPTFTLASPGSLSVAYTSQEGTTLRIGRLVLDWGRILFTPTLGTGSGPARITLGFTTSADSFIPIIAMQCSNGVTFPTGTTQALGSVLPSSNHFEIASVGSGTGASLWGTTQFPDGVSRNVRWTAIYLVD